MRWLALTVVLVAAALALHAMGRPWWCQAGDLTPWSVQVQSRHNSQHLIDAYSVTHAMHGLLFYWALWLTLGSFAGPTTRAGIALGIETTWEIVENTNAMIERYRATTISLDYYGDSVVNSVTDILAMAFGFWLVSRLRIRASIALMVAIDVALLILVRDSLAVNIIMLIHPVDAIRQWQLR